MTPRVLIVDDSENNRLVLMDVLEEEGYALTQAVDGLDALARIERDPPDLVLLDVMMPGIDGLECCRRLKADVRTAEIPVILVTALDDDRHIVQGLDAGAADFVTKPFAAPVVRARARAALRGKLALDELRSKNGEIQRLATILETSNKDLESLALHDGLTGLPNRLLLMDRLAGTLERARDDADLRFALLFLDFDRFKHVNDTLGHAAGDELLKSIAWRLRETLRSSDLVVGLVESALPTRLGGDEFVALIEGYRRPEDLERIVERLKETLHQPHSIRGHPIVSTASIGIVTSAWGLATVDEMLRDADAAMYRAKQSGRGQHVYFDDRMQREAAARRELERRFREAVESGRLPICYEPVIRLDDGRLHAVEAVVAWSSPAGERPDAGTLVTLAVETDQLLAFSRHVLERACAHLASWTEEPLSSRLRLIVEIRNRQLRAPGFVGLVGEVLAGTGIDPARLQLQVPEKTLRHDDAPSPDPLKALRALGVQLAVDGTEHGHFALMQPRDIEIASMRIDREFTGQVGDRHHAAIVHAVITLAHNLGIRVTAGDIRDEAQLAQLQALDCDLGQGPLFGGPLESESADSADSAHMISTPASERTI